jgi:hypothetical protein
MERRGGALLLLATVQVLAGQCTYDQQAVGVAAVPPLAYPFDEPAANLAGTGSGRRLQQAMTTAGQTLVVRSLSYRSPATHARVRCTRGHVTVYLHDGVKMAHHERDTARPITLFVRLSSAAAATRTGPLFETYHVFTFVHQHCFPPTVADGSVDST